MSTQHPDNVAAPFFAQSPVLEGEDEIEEAHQVFSTLGMDEQMWDYEGKEVDHYVVKKLLTRYEEFFRQRVLGREVFLTYRVPNPRVERAEGKWLLETLRSIPRSYDVAREFYGEGAVPPVFEVIIPMTISPLELERVYRYYRQQVAGEEVLSLIAGDVPIGQWVGQFEPKTINVIPLFEDIPQLVGCDQIAGEFLRTHPEIPYQRVFLARSDPALNYGYVSAFLALEVALLRLHRLEMEWGKPIYPILGTGSAPFRGNLKPGNVRNCLESYPSVQTFTLQSAFKYDYPLSQVQGAVQEIHSFPRGKPREVDEERSLGIIHRASSTYQQRLQEGLADLALSVSPCVPSRRKRKLHIGLYGYSRGFAGVSLPRAITYCAALYSVGLPPEIIGLDGLAAEDWAYLSQDANFQADLKDSLAFVNEEVLLHYLPGARAILDRVDYQPHPEHKKLARMIYQATREGIRPALIGGMLEEAARVRGFLG
ncbi:MAG: phosphoenolpyruvate carboxylase [Chloroflexi bacterium]|nr:phosphoenolpyruvate carboxylase [Chloroflexota bacterium]